jgi:DegV family protein with EDD domain
MILADLGRISADIMGEQYQMRIVIDEAGDIPADLAKKYDIRTVPINIMFGTEQYLSNVDIDHATFYEKTKHVDSNSFPKTSQPTPYQFLKCYQEILAEGEDEILSIVVSQKLSGTYSSAVQAATEMEGQGTFHIFDSMAGSAVQGFMAIEAARMIAADADLDAIWVKLKQMRDEMTVVLTIDSLEYAVKGGRVSSMKSIMASLLSIKPILRVVDGTFEETTRVRTRKRALATIVELVRQHVGDRPTRLAVIHADAMRDARRLQEMARKVLTATEEFLMELSIPVAVNLGPGALGIVAIPE